MITTIVYLYVLLDRGASRYITRSAHPNYTSCFLALEKTKIVVAGDEAAVAWCGVDDEYSYEGTWHKETPAK